MFNRKRRRRIYLSGKEFSLLSFNLCFDLCSITVGKNEIFGNAIYEIGQTSYIGKGEIKQCGPKLSISSDSTIYFSFIKPISRETNYTDCYSTRGPSTFGVRSQTFETIFTQTNNGTSNHLTRGYSTTISIEKSNFIGWNQYSNANVFYTESSSTTLIDCYVFISKIGALGGVTFTNCGGNLATTGISIEPTTQNLIVYSADYYHCNHVYLTCNSNNYRFISFHTCISLFQLHF